ncbi:unnamed protein product [Enterobius vermicularis]|uniref:Uncharacterized protein n=1 Tax=Enterobius vermicularis TaxID=51028 RepID=A0A0N4VDT8_ENTVE|nr:unnamed protein product [Enterobius vermicularis]
MKKEKRIEERKRRENEREREKKKERKNKKAKELRGKERKKEGKKKEIKKITIIYVQFKCPSFFDTNFDHHQSSLPLPLPQLPPSSSPLSSLQLQFYDGVIT